MSNIFYTMKESQEEVLSEGGNVFHKMAGGKTDKSSLIENTLGATGGLAALGGGVYATKKGIESVKNYWQAPRKLLNPIEEDLSSMQQKIPSMRGMRYQDIPGRIQSQMAEQRLQIKDFDDLMLSTSAEELAGSVKTAYPKLREVNFKAYGEALKTGEDLITKSGKQLSPMSFNDDVITQAVKELKNTLPEDTIGKLKPMAIKSADDTITLSQAKKYLTELKSDLPAEGQRIVDRKWGGFLEKNAPTEVKSVLSKANAKYANFIDQDKALRKLIDPKTGDYDYDKLYRYTFQRAKTKINSDFKKLMTGLSEIEPDVGAKAKNIYSLRAKRIDMQRTLNNLRTTLTKAEELVSKKSALLERFPQRLKGAGKLIGDVGKGVARGMLFKGLGGLALGAIDPANEVTKQTMGAYPIEVIGAIIDKKKRPSEEEFNRWLEKQII